jgi:Tat protein translocase TatB subunit
MNVFGIGSGEMVLLLVAALLIFGPGKLPEVAGQVGKAVRDFRRMTSDLTGEFEKTIAEASDIKDAFTSELSGIRSQVSSVSESVKKDLTKPGAAAAATTSVKSSISSAKTPSTSASTSSSDTPSVSAPKATKANPLAGLSLLAEAPPRPGVVEPPEDDLESVDNADPGEITGFFEGAPRPAAGGPAAEQMTPSNDALVRARQRRASAGYQQTRRAG